ncbi:MAG: hydantoinase/oxoprolinase family protein [Actinomycetota bacterium]|nr:MAG: hydantoinase/oxoprolinase family protein [Actinomycetota bacterium]
MNGQLRIGVDVGGTFTDVVVSRGGTMVHGKSDTTAFDLRVGVTNAIEEAARLFDMTVNELLGSAQSMVYSTTVGTNALIEHKGPVLGLITTHGFEDALLVGRGRNWADGLSVEERYDRGRARRPRPLIPRDLVVGVHERLGNKGEVLVPLRDEEVLRKIQYLVDRGVRGIVVVLLYSYVNPAHENRIRNLILEQYPDVYLGHMPVFLSSELSPQMGEYRRMTTCILDAFLRLETEEHLVALNEDLRDYGYTKPLLIAKCTGGASSLSRTRPIQQFGSGPVSGIIGATSISRDYKLPSVFLTDMGGTSFDLGLVLEGHERIYEYDPVIDRWRVQVPLVAHWSIGAGGGSIASVQDGILKVGPQSAHSLPGPACYARGGVEPTVTDADVVLGYIDPDYFLGGRILLDKSKAASAVTERIANPLGISTYEAAWNIKRLVDGMMGQEIYRIAAQMSGLDPREFVAFAYGGAGPVHAAGYADAADVSKVATFEFGSVGGAYGTLSLDIVQVYERTHSDILYSGGNYSQSSITPINDVMQLLLKEAERDMDEEGFDLSQIRFEFEMLLRFGQQRHVLPIPWSEAGFSDVAQIQEVVEAFVKAYGDAYGKGAVFLEAGVEVLGIRLSAIGETQRPQTAGHRATGVIQTTAPHGHRFAYWGFDHGEIETPVYRRDELPDDFQICGPALIESIDTVCVLPPGWTFQLDKRRVGWLERGEVL